MIRALLLTFAVLGSAQQPSSQYPGNVAVGSTSCCMASLGACSPGLALCTSLCTSGGATGMCPTMSPSVSPMCCDPTRTPCTAGAITCSSGVVSSAPSGRPSYPPFSGTGMPMPSNGGGVPPMVSASPSAYPQRTSQTSTMVPVQQSVAPSAMPSRSLTSTATATATSTPRPSSAATQRATATETPKVDVPSSSASITPRADVPSATSTTTPKADVPSATSTTTPKADIPSTTSTTTPKSDVPSATSTITPKADAPSATSTMTAKANSATPTATVKYSAPPTPRGYPSRWPIATGIQVIGSVRKVNITFTLPGANPFVLSTPQNVENLHYAIGCVLRTPVKNITIQNISYVGINGLNQGLLFAPSIMTTDTQSCAPLILGNARQLQAVATGSVVDLFIENPSSEVQASDIGSLVNALTTSNQLESYATTPAQPTVSPPSNVSASVGVGLGIFAAAILLLVGGGFIYTTVYKKPKKPIQAKTTPNPSYRNNYVGRSEFRPIALDV